VLQNKRKQKKTKENQRSFFKSSVFAEPDQPLPEEAVSPARSSAKIKIEIGRRPFY
jgi:hypothetical protein